MATRCAWTTWTTSAFAPRCAARPGNRNSWPGPWPTDRHSRQLRAQSEARKRSEVTYADVDAALARQWLRAAGAHTLIHGHTHRPAEHALGEGLRRIVLSDWDAGAQPPRAQVLRLTAAAGAQRIDVF